MRFRVDIFKFLFLDDYDDLKKYTVVGAMLGLGTSIWVATEYVQPAFLSIEGMNNQVANLLTSLVWVSTLSRLGLIVGSTSGVIAGLLTDKDVQTDIYEFAIEPGINFITKFTPTFGLFSRNNQRIANHQTENNDIQYQENHELQRAQ